VGCYIVIIMVPPHNLTVIGTMSLVVPPYFAKKYASLQID